MIEIKREVRYNRQDYIRCRIASAALGNAIRVAGKGGTVCVIQFLKSPENLEFMSRLEPEIRYFRFERSETAFAEMTEEQKQEEKQNIANGLNFAKKLLTTEECDLLVLDEVLGVLEEGMADMSEVLQVLRARSPFTSIILTGRTLPPEIGELAGSILNIVAEK